MNKYRIIDHPVLGEWETRKKLMFNFDGKAYTAYEGDTIASALLANRIKMLRVHEKSGKPRGVYCNIGHCMECRVTVDGIPNIRACLTPIRPGMQVESGKQLPSPLKSGLQTGLLPRNFAEFMKTNQAKKEVSPDA